MELNQKFLDEGAKFQILLVKYYNLFTFLMIPIYAGISTLVYRKMYNFAENLVITSYIHGFLFIPTTLLFVFGIYTDPMIYGLLSLPLIIFYYLYVYGRLGKLAFDRIVLYAQRFFVIMFLLAIPFLITGTIQGMMMAKNI